MTQQISKFDQGFVMVRGADIETKMVHVTGHKHPQLQVTVADRYTSVAHHRSAWADTARQMDELVVRDRLQGGSFFIHEESGQILSHKLRDYSGFVHSDENINSLLNHVGSNVSSGGRRREGQMMLQNVHSTVEMKIPFLQQGGDFNSELSFAWDPFRSHVDGVFRLVRVICSNGMVGLSDFMNCKIPLVNEWVEHLQIANKQIQNKVSNLLFDRVDAMSKQRASVRDCQRIVDSCFARMKNVHNNTAPNMDVLRNIIEVCDPQLHLKSHYNDTVFNDRRLSEQAASHLTQFTLWNMVTELATHTLASEDSTTLAVQKHANELFLPPANKLVVGNNTSNIVARFDDLDAAFAGDLS